MPASGTLASRWHRRRHLARGNWRSETARAAARLPARRRVDVAQRRADRHGSPPLPPGRAAVSARRLLRRITPWLRRGLVGCAGLVVLVTSAAAKTPPAETVEYYALDAVGSVRVVFDASGNILGRMDYIGSVPMGAEIVLNYNTGEASVFRHAGVQGGWNGFFSASVTTSLIWGLGDSNRSYQGRFYGASVSRGYVGASLQRSPGGAVVSAGPTLGVNALAAETTLGGAGTEYSSPIRIGNFFRGRFGTSFDDYAYLARQFCR